MDYAVVLISLYEQHTPHTPLRYSKSVFAFISYITYKLLFPWAGIWKQNPACGYQNLAQSREIRVQALKSITNVSAPWS